MNNVISSSSSTHTTYPYGSSTDPIVAPSQLLPIRGVNIGGWLVLERYITPSVFAITKCHLDGNPCWYPTSSVVLNQNKNSTTNTNTETSNGIEDSFLETLEAGRAHHEMILSSVERKEQQQRQHDHMMGMEQTSNSYSSYRLCSSHCTDHPVLIDNIFNATDYPLDEWNLAQVFREYSTSQTGEEWLNVHFDTFVTFDDLVTVQQAGMTHIRVPLPHWILQDHPSATSDYPDLYQSLQQQEPYLVGHRWKYFVRLCGWADQLGLQVWPNIHTAPNSQNAFDNSGHQGKSKTCHGWMNNTTTTINNNHENDNHGYPLFVYQSLQVLDHITKQIKRDGIDNVITGFGLLNEPYTDCDMTVYRRFLDDGLDIVRNNLGESTKVFVSDAFWAPQFNDGHWWLDPKRYHGTYLDSHYYTVFTNDERHMPPQQHIDHVCHPPKQKGLAIADCCYQDPHHSNSTRPSQGVGRIVTEFSAAFDSMPGELLKIILQGYIEHGQAPSNNRTLSDERKTFLQLYTQAQMIAFEDATSVGWFFWSLKMENDAFFEWNFLKGVELGWFPKLPSSTSSSSLSSSEQQSTVPSSLDLYGSCNNLAHQAASLNASKIVNTYPWGDETSYRYWDPSGLGWKFDHEQEMVMHSNNKTTSNNHNKNTYSGHDTNAYDPVVQKIQNVSTMMNLTMTTSSNRDESLSTAWTNDVWVWIQVVAVAIVVGLAYRRIRQGLDIGHPKRFEYEYEPIKQQQGRNKNRNSRGFRDYGSTDTDSFDGEVDATNV
ncbi:hypothetical protein IV203_018894 [Nitzschia inconspicua]|uniref:glucan 1,3-beta-glucosidase n=1 Tax=Nitzschia inconspicua TaxID=303405 RepID=A0A9K3M605_9STRA|nr:hypothetical protein IV203_018894 [Nitzschia inconspicua]